MPVLVTTRIPGLPAEAYDETAAHLAGPLRGAEGFIAHAAAADSDGVTVTELWEKEADWMGFFETYVKPNLPETLPAPTMVEIRNTILR
jgi:heme-degrading monooxygenase HmoA